MEAFGRIEMDREKQKMRNVLSREISQCDMLRNGTTKNISNFCGYHKKDEFLMIDEVRDIQRHKSLDILSRLKPDSTKQR